MKKIKYTIETDLTSEWMSIGNNMYARRVGRGVIQIAEEVRLKNGVD